MNRRRTLHFAISAALAVRAPVSNACSWLPWRKFHANSRPDGRRTPMVRCSRSSVQACGTPRSFRYAAEATSRVGALQMRCATMPWGGVLPPRIPMSKPSLTGDEALTDSQRAAVLTRLLARPVNFVEVPQGAATDGMRRSGMPEVLAEWLGSLNALVAAGYASGISPDFKALLGRPAIGFERFVADHLAAWA